MADDVTGRRDATGPDPPGRLPEETLSAAQQLECFGAMGFDAREFVALCGAHTVCSTDHSKDNKIGCKEKGQEDVARGCVI